MSNQRRPSQRRRGGIPVPPGPFHTTDPSEIVQYEANASCRSMRLFVPSITAIFSNREDYDFDESDWDEEEIKEEIKESSRTTRIKNRNLAKEAPLGDRNNPLLNACVLSEVLKFLPVKQLKECRLVNSTWKAESTTWLRRKSFVTFRFTCEFDSGLFKPKQWHYEFFKYLKMSNNIICENINVELSNRKVYFSNNISMNGSEELDDTDFNIPFQKFGSQIKQLKFNSSNWTIVKTQIQDNDQFYNYNTSKVYFTYDQQCWLNIIFTNNKFPHLTHLKLELGHHKAEEIELNNFSPLPSVHNFELKVLTGSKCNRVIVEKLLQILPNIKTLAVTSATIPFLGKNPSQFVDQIYNQLENLKRLVNITIKTIGFPSLEILSKLPAKAKKLDLLLPTINRSIEMENFFAKHAPEVEELYLILPTTKESREGESPVQVVLPPFKKLKKLRLEHMLRGFDNPLYMELLFSTGELVYAEQFPMLEELSLGDKFSFSSIFAWKGAWKFYESFIPPGDQVVEKLKVFNAPYFDEYMFEEEIFEIDCMEFMLRVGKLFPNIRPKYFQDLKIVYEDYLKDEAERKAKEKKMIPPSQIVLRVRKTVNYSDKKRRKKSV